MTLALALEIALSRHVWTLARALAALLIAIPLAFRSRFPLVALTTVLAGTIVLAALGGHRLSGAVLPVIAVILALYTVGSRTRGIRLTLAACATLGGLLTASLLA